MTYENPLPPEGINVSRENHLAALIWLVIGFTASVAALVAGLYLAGGFLASQMPFAWETSLSERLLSAEVTPQRPPREKLLQQIVDRLAAKATLPTGVTFRVRYADDAEVNAYAGFGGVITMHRGLMDRLDSENAVAFVLAHEMAHIINRDPAEAMGGRLLVASIIGLFSLSGGADWLQGLTSSTQAMTLLTFSREDERTADRMGAQMTGQLYGHLGGVEKVLSELVAAEHELGADWVPEMLKTHPDSQKRLTDLPLDAEKTGFSLSGSLTPLPLGLRKRPE